jgi:hypothetical protein
MALCPGLVLQVWQQQSLPHSTTLIFTHPPSLWIKWHNWLCPRNTSVMNPLDHVALLCRSLSKLHWLQQSHPSNHLPQPYWTTPHNWHFSPPTLFPVYTVSWLQAFFGILEPRRRDLQVVCKYRFEYIYLTLSPTICTLYSLYPSWQR